MFTRYAVYFVPGGALGENAASWLGWDLCKGQHVGQPDWEGLDVLKLTEAPRRYGFHATIKPPFHLADGTTEEELQTALAVLCGSLSPVSLAALELAAMGRFLVLAPVGNHPGISALAAEIVEQLDRFRAAPTEDELARRRAQPLRKEHEQNLRDWGYPYVMDQFRFHMTLTGRLEANERDIVIEALETLVIPSLPTPFFVGDVALVGQAKSGFFHLIRRFPLGA